MKRKKERLKHRCGREKKQGEGRKEGERKRQRQRKRRPNLQKVLRQLCVLRAWIGEFCNLELDSLGNFSTFSFFFFFCQQRPEQRRKHKYFTKMPGHHSGTHPSQTPHCRLPSCESHTLGSPQSFGRAPFTQCLAEMVSFLKKKCPSLPL